MKRQQLITANVELELKAHSETIATISKTIDLPNVYERAETIPTDFILMGKETVTSELAISAVDSETGIVHLRPDPFAKVSIQSHLENANIQTLKHCIEQSGWNVTLSLEGLKNLEEKAKVQEKLERTRDDRLSNSKYIKKYQLKLTKCQLVASQLLTLGIILMSAALLKLKLTNDIFGETWRWVDVVTCISLVVLFSFGRDKAVEKYMVYKHKKAQKLSDSNNVNQVVNVDTVDLENLPEETAKSLESNVSYKVSLKQDK